MADLIDALDPSVVVDGVSLSKAKPPYGLTGPDGLITQDADFSQVVIRGVDHLMRMQLDENPAVSRYQKITKLCEIGNVLSHLYGKSIEDVQPMQDDYAIGVVPGLGYGLGAGLGIPRRVGGNFVGGDQAELLRTLIGALERVYPNIRNPPAEAVDVTNAPPAAPVDPAPPVEPGPDGMVIP